MCENCENLECIISDLSYEVDALLEQNEVLLEKNKRMGEFIQNLERDSVDILREVDRM